MGDDITTEVLLGIRERLLAGTRMQEWGGRFRKQQN